MKTNKIVIAVDGYSSSGKSTMARALASRLGYRYIDSGAMYRAVTLYALRHGLVDDIDKLTTVLDHINIDFEATSDGRQRTLLNGCDVTTDIRSMQVSEHVSRLAADPRIRRRLVNLQQEMGQKKGIVMDGRDIGTTVFPDAELKIFVNASAQTRAQRRYKELREKGDTTSTYDEILENIRQRDYLDTHREESPLKCADDALVLDNSEMTVEQQNAWLDRKVRECLQKLT